MNRRVLIVLSVSLLVTVILFATVLVPRFGLKGGIEALGIIAVISAVPVFLRQVF